MKNRKSDRSMTATNDTKIALLEQSITHVHETLHRIEKTISDGLAKNEANFNTGLAKNEANFNAGLAKSDANLKKVEIELKQEIIEVKQELKQDIKEVSKQSWDQFKWLMATFIVMFGGAVTTMILKSLHLIS